MPVLIEAALRSLLVGLVVALGLRVFRVRNVLVQKAAWGLVLLTAFAMPVMLPIAARWQALPAGATLVLPSHPMTLLEELQARLQAKSASGNKTAPLRTHTPQADKPRTKVSPSPQIGPQRGQSVKAVSSHRQRAERSFKFSEPPIHALRPAEEMPPQRSHTTVLLSAVAFLLYLGIAALFLLRLMLGLAATLRLWLAAEPVPIQKVCSIPASVPIRASTRISSPVNIGSAVLLPADYESWDPQKLSIVLAHEHSHIRQGDFYLQLIAGLYTALVWFSPLGWWIKRELADLAEAISDRAALEAAHSRISYAQILFEFAVAPRTALIGVAMARPSSLARRIERLLNDHAFRQSFAGRRRALVVVALVPVAIFTATAMVRVEAAQSAPHSLAAQLASFAALAPVPQLETAALMAQVASEAASPNNLPVPAAAIVRPADVPETEGQTINSNEIATSAPSALQLLLVAHAVPVVHAVAAGQDQKGALSFERTLSISGETQLIVSTGSGNIHFTHGSSSQIQIHGQIHVHRDASEEEARAIAANPPIEQNGSVIRVGQHEEHWHGISIDYQIEAPAGTLLTANSGSGDIVDEGVGQNAKLETGSGDIHASGLEGSFLVKTGSGNITAEQTGQGDVKAETGSGDIEIKDVHGSFRAETGSGNIKASGTPSAPWTLQTGSGNIECWTGNAALTLDASTGSGSVTTDHEMLIKGSLNNHHVTGNLNGGGPTLRAETGSGDIHVH